MTPEEITATLQDLFAADVEIAAPHSWQVDTGNCRLLVLLSDDFKWLRILVPILPAQEALPFLEKLLEANFDVTQETRYALHQNVLWGVFQHDFESLFKADFTVVVKRLLSLHQRKLSGFFNELIESRLRQIIEAAKHRGQSLEATLQTLDRFYAEGLMGELGMGAETRELTLTAWRRQLERLWPEVE